MSRFATAAAVILLFCSSALKAQDTVPRIEIGALLSSANQSDIGNYYHVGGGGRVTVNVTRYLAGEVEATRQPAGNSAYPPDVHTAIAAKATYRAEQQRWLRFAGLNFFGVVGPAFVNHGQVFKSSTRGRQRGAAADGKHGGLGRRV